MFQAVSILGGLFSFTTNISTWSFQLGNFGIGVGEGIFSWYYRIVLHVVVDYWSDGFSLISDWFFPYCILQFKGFAGPKFTCVALSHTPKFINHHSSGVSTENDLFLLAQKIKRGWQRGTGLLSSSWGRWREWCRQAIAFDTQADDAGNISIIKHDEYIRICT